MGAWIPGVIQGAQAKNAAKDQKAASAELTRRMEQSRQAYQGRRPEMANQKWNAMQQTLGQFQPAIGMMNEMTGGKYAPDLSKLSNPVQLKANQYDLSAGDPHQRPLDQIPVEDQAAALRRMKEAGYDTTDMERRIRQSTTAERARQAAATAGATPKPTSVAAEYERRYGSKK